jgi:Protein of unknown function (DUF2628)
MLTFTVHEPPHPPADRIDRAASLVFVKDGFSWPAALFAPLWFLAHQLWLPLLGYIVASGALEVVSWAVWLDSRWITLAIIALHVLIGLEAGTLRRWTLERGGWRTLGAVSGRNATECERRFFDEWLPEQPVIAPAPGAPTPRGGSAQGPSPAKKTPVIGSLQGIRS